MPFWNRGGKAATPESSAPLRPRVDDLDNAITERTRSGVFYHRYVQYFIAPVLLLLIALPLLERNGFDIPVVVANFVKTATVFSLLALGASLVIATSNIDLSSIGVASMSGVIFVLMLWRLEAPSMGGIILAALVALAFSALSGLVVAICFLMLRPPLLIFTWALGAIYNVLTILLTKLQSLTDDSGVRLPWELADDRWHFGHYAFLGGIAALGATLVVVSMMSLPQRAQAIGASETSAEYAGVPRRRTLFLCFVINALLAGLAGIFHVLYLSRASTRDLVGNELAPIAIAVLGGTSLAGGYLSLWSVIAASFFWAGTRLLGPMLPTMLNIEVFRGIEAEFGQILFFSIFLVVALVFGNVLMPRFPKIYARREVRP